MEMHWKKEQIMKCDKKDLLLYAVTDRRWLADDETLYMQVEKAIAGGVSFVQLREKELARDLFLEEAKEIKELCRKHNIPFVINDNVDIAIAMDADGVHVGQSDMEAGDVREKLGPDKIIGVSAQTVEQAKLAEKRGADYLGVGAVFATGSKEDAVEVDFRTLKDICRAVNIPVIAIGGIGADNVKELAGSGICGIAVISAIFAQKDVEAASRRLRELTEEMTKEPMQPAKNIRGVIFDVDGTLLDSMKIWDDAGKRYLRSLGKEPEADLNKILFALSLADGAAYLKERYNLTESAEEINQGILNIVDDFYRDEAQAKAGVNELLAALAEKGVAMTVATSSDKRQILNALERLDLAKYFMEVFTCGEVGGSKSEPEIFHKAAELMGTTPEETCVVEDGLYALRTANKAGYFTIGVYDDSSRDDWQDLQNEADLAFESLENTEDIIKKLTV